MHPYVFQNLDVKVPGGPLKQPGAKAQKKDPFMLFATPHYPRTLFTKQDMDQAYQAGYVDAKSTSLKELQQEAEFQKIESLKMMADYFPQFIQQNQENCSLFYQNVLQIAQKIVAKLLPQDKTESACQVIISAFKNTIEPLCQQDHLQICLHPDMYEKVHGSIQQTFAEKGARVPIEFLKREDLKISECHVQWPEGMLVIDQAALENDLQQLLTIHTIKNEIPLVKLEQLPSTTTDNQGEYA